MTGLTASTAGRPRSPVVESMVGLFINTVPPRHRIRRARDPHGDAAAPPGRADPPAAPPAPRALRDPAPVRRHRRTLRHALRLPELPSSGAARRGAADTRSTARHPILDSRDATHYPLALVTAPGTPARLPLDYRSDAVARHGPSRARPAAPPSSTPWSATSTSLVASAELLLAGERRRGGGGGNATAGGAPSVSLADLFVEQVRRSPDAVAVVFGGVSVSYAELDARACALAGGWLGGGVGAGDRVGVMVPRSVELVVSLLAVHRWGAAYVPVDAGYPVERVRYVLEDDGSVGGADGGGGCCSRVRGRGAGGVCGCEALSGGGVSCRVRCRVRRAMVLVRRVRRGVRRVWWFRHQGVVNRLRVAPDPLDPLASTTAFSQKTPIGFDRLRTPSSSGRSSPAPTSSMVAAPDGHRDPACSPT